MTSPCPRCGREYPPGRLGVCPVCLLEADVPPALLGDTLELLEEIGRGGMGSVWKARHLRLDRLVAVKFLDPALASDPEFEMRFEREARALALLSHPGIVAVHDFGHAEGRSFIVMEYVDGRPLSAALPLPVEDAVDVARQICDALAYAHAKGVVHRDVKPENILLDGAGNAKVTDFGIARLIHPSGHDWTLTTAGRLVGTPHYMAPEAVAGAPPDPRMDVFSLGMLIYETVRGQRPVGNFSSLPGDLDRIVRRALSPDPGQRQSDAAEMGRDLALLAGATGGALPAHEQPWLHVVALVETLATAVGLWAFLLSVTPRVLSPGDVQPLIMLGGEALPDGRIVSRARFETWPTLAAVAALATGVAAYGLLRRHWRQAGLDRPRPDGPARESRNVLVCGIASVAMYGLHHWLISRGPEWTFAYVPILGGLIELAALFFFWVAILEAWRTSRPLRRDAALWAGVCLALVPPVIDLVLFVRAWQAH